ncbi:hypothetical protein F5X68DRAFT_275601 [Plectosphaerella plurivora]|uniref:Uncharacterized protein n=1 Tax=Plectosphaerella plurivora TaxID=936078 RepID=A0A9P8VB78_9PEZI|nr:hypothetical protein F5X68DRAFT_275601 [Plectosphaerella plurivora]
MASDAVSPLKITHNEFDEVLARYGPLIDSISSSKAKPGQKTLEELDRFRYDEGPWLFSQEDPQRPMNHDDVKTLVDWKLRHGKFRPTLMKLVTSNESDFVETTIVEALKVYKKDTDISKTLAVLTKLKGIGPATASLLLAVHYPNDVPFFSDEAYYWLCNGGRAETLKYTMKEYETLISASKKLMKKLDVTALQVEQVAYVLLKEGGKEPAKAPSTAKKTKPAAAPSQARKVSPPAKRKAATDASLQDQGNLRRSKRGKEA